MKTQPLNEVLKMATPGPWTQHPSESAEVCTDIYCIAAFDDHFSPGGATNIANAAITAHFRNIGPELVDMLYACAAEFARFNRHSMAREVNALLDRAKEVQVL